MPSIIDQIAAEFNVSGATVSRALNDRPGVSAALRERILARARELNFSPTLTARSLATSQTFNLGFFVREKQELGQRTDPFYSEILSGVEQFSAKTDYHVSFATLSHDILDAPHEFRFVRERRIDGMVLAGPDIPNDFILAMRQAELPLVLVDNELPFTQVNCVNSDDVNGGYLAAQHLIEKGHNSIGVITGPSSWASNARRVRGYRLALSEANLPFQCIQVERTTIDSGAAAFEKLAAGFPGVTAVCAVNDAMAIGAIRAAAKSGRRVPDDLAVVGFDDIDWAVLNDPPLTTVAIAKLQMGREAAQRLITIIQDPASQPVEIIVSVNLIERRSS